MSLAPEVLTQLVEKFNSVDQTDRFHGGTRNGVIPYRGQSAESLSEVAVADSQIYPTLDDDALVFKWALEDGVISLNDSSDNIDAVHYLQGKLTLEELKHRYPNSNPFYSIFKRLLYDMDTGTRKFQSRLIPVLAPYYAKLGFVGHYYIFIRRDSSLYRAFQGEIPLTPELFAHGVSPRMEHESSVLFKEQRVDIDYSTNPKAPRVSAGYDFGWSKHQLMEAILNKGGEVPTFLAQRKKWKFNRANTKAVKQLRSLSYTFTNPRGQKETLLKYPDGYFKGILSDMHAFDDYYPEGEIPDTEISPRKDRKISVERINPNISRANLVAIYRYIHYGGHKLPIPRPNMLTERVPLQDYLRDDTPIQYMFRQDPLGYMHLYKHENDVILGEVPVPLWRDLTGLQSYTELYSLREHVDPEVFIATLKRLGIRHFPNDGKQEFVEKNCRAINRFIQYLVQELTGQMAESSTPSSSSLRGASRPSPRGVSKFDLIKSSSQHAEADIAQQDNASMRAASPPRVPAPSSSNPGLMMLPLPPGFSLRPTPK